MRPTTAGLPPTAALWGGRVRGSPGLGSSYVQGADLVVRAPAAGVPMALLEIDRRTEDAHGLAEAAPVWEWGRLLPRDADKHTLDRVRSRPDVIDYVGHEKRL